MLFFQRKYSPSFIEIEKNEWSEYIKIIRPGFIVFDVGANAGELSMLFSHFTGKEGQVHAFEPTPSTFSRLQHMQQAARNKNIHINNIALSFNDQPIILHEYPEEYSGLNTAASRPLKEQGFSIEPIATHSLPCTTIDNYCKKNGIDHIDLLKIDVEGFELNVLKGAENMLFQKKVKCIVFEFGPPTFDMGFNKKDFVDFLESVNYSVKNLYSGYKAMPVAENGQVEYMSLNIARPE